MENPSTNPARPPGLFSKHPLLILTALFLCAYVGVFAMFAGEGHPKTVVTGIDTKAIHFDVHLLNVDLVRDLATFTFSPDMTAPSIATRGHLNADIAVELDTGSAVLNHTFKRGEAPAPWSINIAIQYGDALEYPFDKHGGEFMFRVKGEAGVSPLANVTLDKVVHGFVASARVEPSEDKTEMVLNYEFSRSPAVIFLAMMALVSLSMVVWSAVSVAKHVALHGRKVEFGMLVWIAALLFVIPAVRNGLPGSPPLGSLVDIALFFWLHILGVGSLLTVVSKWKKQV